MSSFGIDYSKVSISKFRLFVWNSYGMELPFLPPNWVLRRYTAWDSTKPGADSSLLLNLRPFSPWLGEGAPEHGPLEEGEIFLYREASYSSDPTLSYREQLAAGERWKNRQLKRMLLSLYRAKDLWPVEKPPSPPSLSLGLGRGRARRVMADSVRCPGALLDRKLWGVEEESESELLARAREGRKERKVPTVINPDWLQEPPQQKEDGEKKKRRKWKRSASLRRKVLTANAWSTVLKKK